MHHTQSHQSERSKQDVELAHIETSDQSLGYVRTKIDVIELTQQHPYTELNFLGTYCAITLGACGAFAGFVMPVTSLAIINADIGPSENLTWVALAWTLLCAIGSTLVGRLSDIFGRRWFLSGCNLVATLGCVLGCTATSINHLIGASALLGLGASGQISFNYVLGELVPVRHRFAANGIIFLCTLPFAGLGPYISRLFIMYTEVSWRGDYYLSLAINGLATICWVVFYHPPKFDRLHKSRTKMQEVMDLDFGGIVLFTSGSLLLLLGLSWGGQSYPWQSSYVIGTLTSGAVLIVIFIFYESFTNLRRPLIPMALFRNYDYVIMTCLSTVGGMVYYFMNIIFPQMVATIFTADVVEGGLLSCTVGGGACAGYFIGSWIAVPGGHMKYKLMFAAAGLCAFVGGVAGAVESQATASALATCGGIMVGLLEIMASTVVTIVIDDQSELGTAAGVFGSLRQAGGVLATAIYVSIFTNRMMSNTNNMVLPALMDAGLTSSAAEQLIAALAGGNTAAANAVPGVNATVLSVGTVALRKASVDAFQVVFLASIAFGGLAFVTACLARDVDDKLSHDIIRRLDQRQPATWSSTEGKDTASRV